MFEKLMNIKYEENPAGVTMEENAIIFEVLHHDIVANETEKYATYEIKFEVIIWDKSLENCFKC